MPKPKLEDAVEVELKLKLVRDGTSEEIGDALASALDEAQAPVFSEEEPFAFVVIKIVP